MPANPRVENDAQRKFKPLKSILSTVPHSQELDSQEPDSQEPDSQKREQTSYPGYEGRRPKAALVLTIVWSGTIALHLVSWGFWLVVGVTGLLCIQALRICFTRPRAIPTPLQGDREAPETEDWPTVSLLVAAKNEEAVIGRLVRMLCNQDYPASKYEVWAIDDRSTDKTATVLEELAREYDNLKVLRRQTGAGGGKSGALNQVLPLTNGEILAVFDADAQVGPDMLRRLLPLFDRSQVGAVQMRKAIVNASLNFWTRGQEAEMALDAFFQQQRRAVTGIGELRGNGQFVRRSALESCGGWNELTITDDLDLTIRLHLDGWDIEFMAFPEVLEEGVANAKALWHQRNRWGEGGYQRYLDYWRLILSNRMGLLKTWDMFGFWAIQYFLPVAAGPDFLMAIAYRDLPVMSPLSALAIFLSCMGMFTGLRRINKNEKLTIGRFFITGLKTLRGTLYMFHWFVIIASVSFRMSIRPKRLKWVKTMHEGTGELQL